MQDTETTTRAEEPQMSEAGTLGNIFFEPENTFKDLKRKPRYIIAGVIMALLIGAYAFGLNAKIGEEGMRSFVAEQIEKRAPNLDKDARDKQVDLQMNISKYTRFAVPVFVFVSFFIGGLFYFLGAKAFGGTGGFMHNLSVWVYSSFPPTVLAMAASFIVMALRSAEDIDLAASQRGLVQQFTNLSFLVGKEHPVISTVVATFDIFSIWGWILAAIGLRVVNKMSKGSAWAVVLIIALVGVGFRLVGALLSGNPS